MKFAALTMVYRDYPALRRWVDHFGGLFGRQNLYVVSHGGDPEHDKIAHGCNIIFMPRDDLKRFDLKRGIKMAAIRRCIEADYDAVFQTYADELLFFRPDFQFNPDGRAIFAIGMQAFPDGFFFSSRFCKAVAAWGGNRLHLHGVRLQSEPLYTPNLTPGLFLVHTKYYDVDALAASNEVRSEVANGAPGQVDTASWRKPLKISLEHIKVYEKRAWGDWDVALAEFCNAMPAKWRVMPCGKTIAAKTHRSPCRVRLPEWTGL